MNNELSPICTSQRYVLRFANHTLDTILCSSPRLARRIKSMGSVRGSVTTDCVQVPTLLDLELRADKFVFPYMSMN